MKENPIFSDGRMKSAFVVDVGFVWFTERVFRDKRKTTEEKERKEIANSQEEEKRQTFIIVMSFVRLFYPINRRIMTEVVILHEWCSSKKINWN